MSMNGSNHNFVLCHMNYYLTAIDHCDVNHNFPHFETAFFFFNTFQHSWKVFMHSVFCLSVCSSVCPSVCPRSNSRKYSLNVLKLIYVIYIWHRMNRIENGIYTTNGLSTETHKRFSDTLQAIGGKCLKRILKYLYWTKYNEIKICHSDIQKDISLWKIASIL